MSLAQLKRIGLQDVPGAPSWMRPVFAFLNQIVEVINQAFAKGQTLRENLSGDVVELEVRTTADYTSGVMSAVRFKARLGGLRASGVKVFKVTDLDSPDAILTGNFTASTWEQQSDEIVVKFVSGLQASHRYSVRFWVAV